MSIPFPQSGWFPQSGRRRGPRRFGPGVGFEARFGPGDRPGFAASEGHEGHHGPHGAQHEPGEGEPDPGFAPFPPGAPGFRRGGRRGFIGRPGFGPGFMPGFGPGSGPGFGGPHGPRGRGRGGRGGRRGNVRSAVLALLAEEPRHGYAIMNELAERSGGLWRPSPGSVYPVLQQLQDEGLVLVEEADGRRIFTLSQAGQDYVAAHQDEMQEPWRATESGPAERLRAIMFSVQALNAAAQQVARLADDAQAEQAVAAVDEARRKLYRILGGDDQ